MRRGHAEDAAPEEPGRCTSKQPSWSSSSRAFAHSIPGNANSLVPNASGRETFDATLFAGARLWDGGEIYVDPEIDQGFGLSGTLGVAGFPSGEAYKVGSETPYFRLQRLFFRQSFDLGGDVRPIAAGANQLGGTQSADNLILTAGKFSVTDIFDTNSLAHDPKSGFSSTGRWSIPAHSTMPPMRGATAAALRPEWTQDWWTLRRRPVRPVARVPNTTTARARLRTIRDRDRGSRNAPFAARQRGRRHAVKLYSAGVNRGRMVTTI